ncbi:MAG TPA: carboxypeptidase-like regulatory domain-containing protein, partial [Haliangium sp.]|nr:carboxypeptidase-like regulatory domain-containing protein [Haliangium sp.]
MNNIGTTAKRGHGAWLALGLAGLLAPLLLAAEPALAQRTTATILGKVTSEAAPAPEGTTVVATNVETGVQHSDTADKDGSYVLAGIQPGQYLLIVNPPGGQEVLRMVSVQVGQSIELDLDLAGAPGGGPGTEGVTGSETIVVVGHLAENKTSEVATNVTREQIENLPQNNR